MREVDQKIPFATDVKKFADSNWTMRELKKMEIQIANAFDWNFGFLTYFDYLEHICNLGVLFNTDMIDSENQKNFNILSTKDCTPNTFLTPEDRLMNKIKKDIENLTNSKKIIEPQSVSKREYTEESAKKELKGSSSNKKSISIQESPKLPKKNQIPINTQQQYLSNTRPLFFFILISE